MRLSSLSCNSFSPDFPFLSLTHMSNSLSSLFQNFTCFLHPILSINRKEWCFDFSNFHPWFFIVLCSEVEWCRNPWLEDRILSFIISMVKLFVGFFCLLMGLKLGFGFHKFVLVDVLVWWNCSFLPQFDSQVRSIAAIEMRV